ncbi:hypothetical protein FB451DRAFT_1391270 [Mycena latifolia]|nr:hypothetical protein FB451DRAFT_1391270 [Mycena latifolia]
MDSPLDIQELLDHCIGFLHDSILDLRACTLVSRSWVSPAQSRIFRKLSIGAEYRDPVPNQHVWERLHNILESSPHLIGHIHDVDLYPRSLSRETFAAVCNFPFTQLRSAYIMPFRIDSAAATALQQLLSHPNLRRTRIVCHFEDPSNLQQIFDRCPAELNHIHLQCVTPLTAWPGSRLSTWLTQDFLPFDFSGLKVLSLSTDTAIVHWRSLVPVLPTLEVFDFVAGENHPPIDLSSFRNLTLLRVCAQTAAAWWRTIDALSTITASHRIRTIVLRGNLDVAPMQLDSILSELPMAAAELEMTTQQYDFVAPNFPQLASKRLLRRTDLAVQWFELSPDVFYYASEWFDVQQVPPVPVRYSLNGAEL